MYEQLLYAHLRALAFARGVRTHVANIFKQNSTEVTIVTTEQEEYASRYEATRERFVAAMVAHTLPMLERVSTTVADVEDAQAAYRARVWENGGEPKKALRARLSSLQTELEHAEAAIRHWSPEQRTDLATWFRAEFDYMQYVPRLHFCEVVGTELLVATQELFGFNIKNKTWHRIGRIGFKVPLAVYSAADILPLIQFKNLDNVSTAAPQIDSKDGRVGCWGPTETQLLHAYRHQNDRRRRYSHSVRRVCRAGRVLRQLASSRSRGSP